MAERCFACAVVALWRRREDVGHWSYWCLDHAPNGCEEIGCDDCGEPMTVRYSGTNYCDDCRPGEEREFANCSICHKHLDMTERPIPLCDYCHGVAKAHGELLHEQQIQEKAERETGQRIDW